MTTITEQGVIRATNQVEDVGGTIDSFRGEHAFLSNMFPCRVEFEGATYPSVEHAYQAAKSLDPSVRKTFDGAITPKGAKARGKRVTLRADWGAVKLGVMEQSLRSKFADGGLRALLVATGDAALVEGNTWNDRFWGVCRGKGQNHLGKLLMRLRSELAANG